MNLPPEERVNMSLDDLIKAKKAKDKNNKKQPSKQKGKLIVTAPSDRNDKKVTRSIAQGRAKRNALTNQRRGLNSSGKASQSDVKKAVRRAIDNKKKRQQQVKTNNLRKSNPPKLGSGLTISFRPAELSQTTDRNVQAQILGALSKDPSYNKNRGNSQGGRKVQSQVNRPVKKKIVVRK